MYDYDVVCIGMGPAGMAVSGMASAMGLSVCSIEKNKVGGECMNVGCIPSKALLQIARHRHFTTQLAKMGLGELPFPEVLDAFGRIQSHLKYIGDNKTVRMFDKVELVLGEGGAEFIDGHTVKVGAREITGRRIFIATGTRPMVLPVAGIDGIDYLTNESVFHLEKVPQSMIVHGGGAIACEMAQAFSRLGCKVYLVQRSDHILSQMDPEAAEIVEKKFVAEGIELMTGRLITSFKKCEDGMIEAVTDKGETIRAEKVLEALGRAHDYSSMKLEKAGVSVNKKGQIRVNKYLQTDNHDIYAVGDCNGHYLFSHSAMHQGMIALMNSLMPWPFKRDFKKYAVPYTVFTDPQVSGVGELPPDLESDSIEYETTEAYYSDYGAAIAEEIPEGFIKIYTSKTAKILGASIVGENSGEMINEWGLAVQKKMRMTDIMLLQHSFPTMGFLSKRVAEIWMMNKVKPSWIHKICRKLFHMGF